MRPRAILGATFVAALITFAGVQDRVTASGARRYVTAASSAASGTPVTVDDVMIPTVGRAVRQGCMWGVLVMITGGTVAMLCSGFRK